MSGHSASTMVRYFACHALESVGTNMAIGMYFSPERELLGTFIPD